MEKTLQYALYHHLYHHLLFMTDDPIIATQREENRDDYSLTTLDEPTYTSAGSTVDHFIFSTNLHALNTKIKSEPTFSDHNLVTLTLNLDNAIEFLAELGFFLSNNGLNFDDIAEFYGVNTAKRRCRENSNNNNGAKPQEVIEISAVPTENDEEMAAEEPDFHVVRLRKPDKPRPARKPAVPPKPSVPTPAVKEIKDTIPPVYSRQLNTFAFSKIAKEPVRVKILPAKGNRHALHAAKKENHEKVKQLLKRNDAALGDTPFPEQKKRRWHSC